MTRALGFRSKVGELTGRNQASYSTDHVRRVRLVRALVSVGGMSIAQTREVIDAIDDPDRPAHSVLGSRQRNLAAPEVETADRTDHEDARRRIDSMLANRGSQSWPDKVNHRFAVITLAEWQSLSGPDLGDLLDNYASAAEILADADLDLISASAIGGRDEMVDTASEVFFGGVLISYLREWRKYRPPPSISPPRNHRTTPVTD